MMFNVMNRSQPNQPNRRQYQALDPNAILYTQLNATIVPAHMNVPELVEVGKCMLIKLNNKDHYPLYQNTPLQILRQQGTFHGTTKQGIPYGTWPNEQLGLMVILPDGPDPDEQRALAVLNSLYSLATRAYPQLIAVPATVNVMQTQLLSLPQPAHTAWVNAVKETGDVCNMIKYVASVSSTMPQQITTPTQQTPAPGPPMNYHQMDMASANNSMQMPSPQYQPPPYVPAPAFGEWTNTQPASFGQINGENNSNVSANPVPAAEQSATGTDNSDILATPGGDKQEQLMSMLAMIQGSLTSLATKQTEMEGRLDSVTGSAVDPKKGKKKRSALDIHQVDPFSDNDDAGNPAFGEDVESRMPLPRRSSRFGADGEDSKKKRKKKAKAALPLPVPDENPEETGEHEQGGEDEEGAEHASEAVALDGGEDDDSSAPATDTLSKKSAKRKRNRARQ